MFHINNTLNVGLSAYEFFRLKMNPPILIPPEDSILDMFCDKTRRQTLTAPLLIILAVIVHSWPIS